MLEAGARNIRGTAYFAAQCAVSYLPDACNRCVRSRLVVFRNWKMLFSALRSGLELDCMSHVLYGRPGEMFRLCVFRVVF
jgi:hypothetical protein